MSHKAPYGFWPPEGKFRAVLVIYGFPDKNHGDFDTFELARKCASETKSSDEIGTVVGWYVINDQGEIIS